MNDLLKRVSLSAQHGGRYWTLAAQHRWAEYAEVLESVVHWAEAPPASDTRSEDFAKIVSRCWEPYGARDRDLLHEPIEGCTEEDLGWMMVDYTDAVVLYHLLRDRDSWYIVYKPPPNVAGA
jgi:hypothetical protein